VLAEHAELQEQAMTDDRERKAAEAKFKKSERATEGAKAISEYNAERQAERDAPESVTRGKRGGGKRPQA
jgi:hypothetical protein